jgi:hypothetical protein
LPDPERAWTRQDAPRLNTIARRFCHLQFRRRIQFTHPDLMPTDSAGVGILQDTESGEDTYFVGTNLAGT